MKQNYLIDIINMIHKRDLLCSSIINSESTYGKTIYKISDGFYDVSILANNGTIEMNFGNIDNDGDGENLYKTVKDLIEFDIIPFCNKNKLNYI